MKQLDLFTSLEEAPKPNKTTITQTLVKAFIQKSFTLKEAYEICSSVNKESVRARIYENTGTIFEKIERGIYIAKDCLLIEGNGRNLDFIESGTIDCIITDHPWCDKKSNKGGNRNFAEYDTFEYTVEDFKEKARVLKDGSFLCEVLPSENENNFDYLYQIKKMAQESGFEYYAKVPWIKGTFISNTGRKSKNSEDLMIFSKGKARNLRIDAKKTKATGVIHYMSGTNGMLPTDFNIQAVANKQKITQSEKPVSLFEELLQFITLENEVVLDQFCGSGAVGKACLKQKRRSILIEKKHELVEIISKQLGVQPIAY